MINTLGRSFVTLWRYLGHKIKILYAFLLANMVKLKVIVEQISACWKIHDVLSQVAA